MDEKAKAATLGLIEQLKRDHPDDSVDQLFKRYQKRLVADPILREAAMWGAFELLCDQLRAEREGIPPGLRKPR